MAERFDGRRVTVMGLGTRGGGVGVARWLAERGATVTVTDLRPAEALAGPLAELDGLGLPVRTVLGRHEETDFVPAGADLVVRNPAVPRGAPMLALARRAGVPVEMEMSLFLRACPAPVIGITGTKGKTTTATLCGAMLRAWDPRTVLAGNMGVSALAHLDAIAPDTPVVLELSSWQVEALIEHRLAPAIGVITNVSEDHLDRYDGFADYAATKRGLVRHQGSDAAAVLNAGDPEAWRAGAETAGRVVPFGTTPGAAGDGAWLAPGGDRLVWRAGGEEVVFDRPTVPALAGDHGAANALAALAAALARGAPPAAVVAGLVGFGGVRDRMESVAEVDGVVFVNDTTATAPAAAVAALHALRGRRVHLIAGGSDKKSNLAPLADAAATAATSVSLLDGTATPALEALLRARGGTPRGPFGDMPGAVAAAAAGAIPGDVVLLSPGCASFGLFQDEFDRGERFRQAVRALAAGGGGASPDGTMPVAAVSGQRETGSEGPQDRP